MRQFKTEKRLNKISKVIKARQHALAVVIENIHDPHNVSAIYRTCDAVGVPNVSLLYTLEEFPKISKVSSASAMKWVKSKKFNSVDKCYSTLKEEGFSIYATLLDESAVSIYDIDMTGKIAFVFGNEHRGVSEDAAEKADKKIYIPMRGMIQSLNVSVATAVTLFEAQRQRALKGMYDFSELSDDEIENFINDWCDK
ncbi:MAG: RNA methyltransferase [Melioribacteraceae bacterium]|nr:RNA methyltransferase [Melioribacteraceae bacterium]